MSLLDVALLMIGIGFALSLIRIARGPSLADVAVAADVCFFCLVATLALLAAKSDAIAFVDAALIGTLLGFLATLALAQLVGRRR